MTIVEVRALYLRNDGVRQQLERLPRRHRKDLTAANALQHVEPPISLRHSVAHHHDTVVLHEEHMLLADQAGEALALLQGVGAAGISVIVGDTTVKKRRG